MSRERVGITEKTRVREIYKEIEETKWGYFSSEYGRGQRREVVGEYRVEPIEIKSPIVNYRRTLSIRVEDIDKEIENIGELLSRNITEIEVSIIEQNTKDRTVKGRIKELIKEVVKIGRREEREREYKEGRMRSMREIEERLEEVERKIERIRERVENGN